MDSYKETINTFNKLAAVYRDKYMDVNMYKEGLDLFCTSVKKNARLFEIACGPGNVTKYLLDRRPDLITESIDLAPNMIALARQNNPGALFKVMDCRDLHTVADKYDGIMCAFCMPYLSKEDCVKLLHDCAALLNVGGIVYLSTIEGDYKKSGYETGSNGIDRCFMYYHGEDFIRETLNSSGFEVIYTARYPLPVRNSNITSDLILVAKKVTDGC